MKILLTSDEIETIRQSQIDSGISVAAYPKRLKVEISNIRKDLEKIVGVYPESNTLPKAKKKIKKKKIGPVIANKQFGLFE